MKSLLRRFPVLSRRRCLQDTRSHSFSLDSTFHGWFEREAKDERHRLQLASFLYTLYDSQATPDLVGYQQRNNHHAKWLERLDESNLTRFLDDCVNNDHIVEGTLFHEALVLAEQLLHDRHNISVIPHEVTHVLVVGDLHGDLASLSHIFNHHGPPTKTLAYVFNGDLIDRGTHSSELLFFVTSLLELFPHRLHPLHTLQQQNPLRTILNTLSNILSNLPSHNAVGPDFLLRVFINRGNHEDVAMNAAYGFNAELHRKYGPTMVPTIQHALQRFYPSLPLCTWIPHYHTFIAHAAPPLLEHHRTGGASPMELGNINRRLHQATTIKKQRQVMSRRSSQQNNDTHANSTAAAISTGTSSQHRQQQQHRDVHNNATVVDHLHTDENAMQMVENMLWSDPSIPDGMGLQPSSSRGAGLLYGLDAIDVWMTAHNVSCFIRSHQCVQFGYEKCPLPETQSVIPSTSSRMDTHDNIDRCLYTVFSSADYRGAGNEGAVLLVSTNGVMPVTFHGDDIIKPRASNLQTDATDGPDPHCHEAYSEDVIKAIFRVLDTNHTGEITKEDVRKGLGLAKSFSLHHDLDHPCVVGDRDQTSDEDLEAIFEHMDKDGSGTVSFPEFVTAFMSLNGEKH